MSWEEDAIARIKCETFAHLQEAKNAISENIESGYYATHIERMGHDAEHLADMTFRWYVSTLIELDRRKAPGYTCVCKEQGRWPCPVTAPRGQKGKAP